MDSVKVGQLILELRRKNNMTQQQLAEKLSVTGQAVSKWENGRGIPDIDSLRKISQEFNIDITAILDGKYTDKGQSKKSKGALVTAIIILVLVILISVFIYFKLKDNGSFVFSSLKSDNSLFEIKGVAAYSNDKKSIYISSIDYVNSDDKNKEYVVMECALYEKNANVEKKISQCGKIDNNMSYDSHDAKTLRELLSTIEFNVDNYSSTCKRLTQDNLYIVINVLNVNDKVVTYKIPLTTDEECLDTK